MYRDRKSFGWECTLLLTLLFLLTGCDEKGAVMIPEGTVLTISLNHTLSTHSSETGALFTANTLEPVLANGSTIIPAGAIVYGRLTDMRRPGGDNGRPARLTLRFTRIDIFGGISQPLDVMPMTIESRPPTQHLGTHRIAAENEPPGAVLSHLTGGRDGAIGSTIGADGIAAVVTNGRHLTLEPGQHIVIRTAQPVEIPALARAGQ